MPVTVRIPPASLSSLDAYIAAQPDPKPSRPEAIRKLLREGLAAKGSLDPTDAETAIDDRIELLEAKVASIPDHDGEPSPEAVMNTMKGALAGAELVGLRSNKKVKPRPATESLALTPGYCRPSNSR